MTFTGVEGGVATQRIDKVSRGETTLHLKEPFNRLLISDALRRHLRVPALSEQQEQFLGAIQEKRAEAPK